VPKALRGMQDAAEVFVRIMRLIWTPGKIEVVIEEGVSVAFEFI
jgi:hypothetical protein